mmetsp:Transcript_82807/g.192424  ORF Transcript_82807/g.192424 Transcript_82807/m.192424 type:complete len:214 (+) Transcript_82807:734-1375(+)
MQHPVWVTINEDLKRLELVVAKDDESLPDVWLHLQHPLRPVKLIERARYVVSITGYCVWLEFAATCRPEMESVADLQGHELQLTCVLNFLAWQSQRKLQVGLVQRPYCAQVVSLIHWLPRSVGEFSTNNRACIGTAVAKTVDARPHWKLLPLVRGGFHGEAVAIVILVIFDMRVQHLQVESRAHEPRHLVSLCQHSQQGKKTSNSLTVAEVCL